MGARILIADDDVEDLIDEEPVETITCWCWAEVPIDEAIEGTCGAASCLRWEAIDRAGGIP